MSPRAKSSATPLRISTGSLQGMSARQLATLKADACNALDARWQTDNRPSTRSRGRPSDKGHVVAACVRIQRTMLRRKKATLGDWYEAVADDLRSHAVALSAPTIKKFTKKWMTEQLPLAALPGGIGPYLINAQNDFSGVRWILIWSDLCEQFPDVRRWLNDYKRQSGTLPSELPHTILPAPLQATIASRLGSPLGPTLYDRVVREYLRSSTKK
jgi:hypothetical protein